MMRSALAVALVLCLTAPAAASAQLMTVEHDTRSPRLRITPFVAYFLPLTRQEIWAYPSGGDTEFVNATTSIGSGKAAGVHVEVAVAGPFGVTAAGGYTSRGYSNVRVESEAPSLLDGSDIVFGRLGISYHLPNETADLVMRRVRMSVFGAAMMMREQPGDAFGLGDLLQDATHYGGSFGFTVERVFSNNRYALQFGVEDHVIRWDELALARIPYIYFGAPGGEPALTTATTGMSHAWLLRAGFSFRF
ncbi:hypothetical protein BH23GEM9_BH23GEM9_21560 [soil metagenome]